MPHQQVAVSRVLAAPGQQVPGQQDGQRHGQRHIRRAAWEELGMWGVHLHNHAGRGVLLPKGLQTFPGTSGFDRRQPVARHGRVA